MNDVPGSRRALAWWIASLVLVAGPASGGEILVSAAVSLVEPLERIAAELRRDPRDLRVRYGLGASNGLAAQIRAGAPVDAFLSADGRIVEELTASGDVEREGQRSFASNRLVLLSPVGSVLRSKGRDALTSPQLRKLAIPGAAVPLGRYARRWLNTHGQLEHLRPRIVLTEHARATLAAVEQGHVDLAIVYASDVCTARGVEVVFAIPAHETPEIAYTAALVAGRPAARRADALEFIAVLTSTLGQQAFRESGFALQVDTREQSER